MKEPNLSIVVFTINLFHHLKNIFQSSRCI